MFLDAHPGWSYRDLQEAPEDVVNLMRRMTYHRAVIREQESRRAESKNRRRR